MAIKQSLAAMDAVMRANARELGLDAGDVLMVLLLGQQPSFAATELAYFSGRPRQQVQRSLMALARRGLVHTGKLPSGRVVAWALTAEGRDILRRLDLRLSAHQDLLGDRADLTAVAVRLDEMVMALVNRPSGYGWLRGLQALPAARLDSEWDRRGVDESEWWEPLHDPILPAEFAEGVRGRDAVAELVGNDDKSAEGAQFVIVAYKRGDPGPPADPVHLD